MNLKTGAIVFLVILTLTAAALGWIAHAVQTWAVPAESLLAESQAANQRGETDLAFRLLVKGAFYSDRPEAFVSAAADPDHQEYLKGIESLRRGQLDDAERRFSRVAQSDSKLLAVRAQIRIEEMRYRTGIPNSARIPF